METTRIQNSQSEQVELLLTDYDNAPITGASVSIRIRRISDDYFYDWDDSTFKASGWTTIADTMSEVDATNDYGFSLININRLQDAEDHLKRCQDKALISKLNLSLHD